MKTLGIVGITGRFKPVHNAHAELLLKLCERAEHVYIGLGSCNKYDFRNPFTAKETSEMIDAILKPKYSNYSFIDIIDFDNGPLWRENVLKLFGKLDFFVTENEYVISLLGKDYNILNAFEIIPEFKKKRAEKKLSSTTIRKLMAENKKWEHLVPIQVAEYIKKNKLDGRFREKFSSILLTN